jgi:hypothetical protein
MRHRQDLFDDSNWRWRWVGILLKLIVAVIFA